MRRKLLVPALVALALASAASVAQGTDLTVPDPYPQIGPAISAATAGDRVVVTQGGTYDPFTLNKAIEVTTNAVDTVTIDGTGYSYAVQITSGSSNAKVSGLTLQGGTSGVVSIGSGWVDNCTINDDTTAYANSAVQIYGGGWLTNSTINLASTTSAQAVYIAGDDYAEVTGCTINSAKGNSGGDYEAIRVSNVTGVDLTNNTIEFSDANTVGQAISFSLSTGTIEDNVITGAKYGIGMTSSTASVKRNIVHTGSASGGWGISLYGVDACPIENNTVYRDSYAAGFCGIQLAASPGTSTIDKNLIVNAGYGAYYNTGTTDGFHHNVFWGPGGHTCNRSLADTLIAVKEPIFCAGWEGSGEFTQRIDSHAAPGNNGWGELVGVGDIECAWGCLDSTTTVPQNKAVTVLEDVTVPSGTALTLEAGAQLQFDDDDDSESGSDHSLNELTVEGTLTVGGSSGSPVQFVSASASPAEGDWWGIYVSGTATISHAEVRHSDQGIRISTASPVTVEYSTLELNSDYDILATGNAGALDLSIDHNTVNVGGGTGIMVMDASSGGTVSYNIVTGNSSSTNGIQVGHTIGAASPSVTGNTVTGVSNGAAVEIVQGSPTLTQNELEDSKQGVKVSAGNALIGTSSSSSDNLIHGNATGILSTCSGGTGSCPNCASTAPVIRNNQIYSNTYGVTRERKGHPNLGTDGSTNAGKNSIYSNTTWCIWDRTSCDVVSAQGNWFGGDCSTPPNCTSGSVDITNYLCSQPADQVWAVEPVPEAWFQGLRVKGVWPNPSRAGVTVQFETGRGVGSVAVRIFDVTGRLIRDLGQQQYEPGMHDVAWDGSTDSGATAPNGLYFVRVMGDGRVQRITKVLVAR